MVFYRTVLSLKRFFDLLAIFFSILFDFKLNGPERLRIFLERAGGAFIKLGQILSLRQNFLPVSYTSELLKLLDSIPSADFFEIEKVFIEEKGRTINYFFHEFVKEPVASGSIAQVHFGRMKPSFAGLPEEISPDSYPKVAVKIQRPETKEKFEGDFSLICFFADILDFFRFFSSIKAGEIASDFVRWTKRELDFKFEAKNADIIYKHSEAHVRTVIPKQYLEMTTSRVLFQEFIEGGVKAEDILLGKVTKKELVEKNINIDEIAVYLIKDEMRQYFIDGFFHADPHPANLVFLPNNKLVYLDFGIVGEIKTQRLNLLRFLYYGIVKRDVDFIARSFFNVGQKFLREDLHVFLKDGLHNSHAVQKVIEKIKELIIEDFKEELRKITDSWFESISDKNSSMFKKSAAVALVKIIKKTEEYGIILPKEAILFFRALSILDMVALQLSSDFDMIKALDAFFTEYPLEKTELMIQEGSHEEEVGKKIALQPEYEWEFFKEITNLEKEKILLMKEKMMEIFFYYAERHEEIRSMLKNLK